MLLFNLETFTMRLHTHLNILIRHAMIKLYTLSHLIIIYLLFNTHAVTYYYSFKCIFVLTLSFSSLNFNNI